MVHFDSECLEYSGGGVNSSVSADGFFYEVGELFCCFEFSELPSFSNFQGEFSGFSFFSVLFEDFHESFFRVFVYDVCGCCFKSVVETHVQGPFTHEGEASFGVVYVRGSESKIEKDCVYCFDSCF